MVPMSTSSARTLRRWIWINKHSQKREETCLWLEQLNKHLWLKRWWKFNKISLVMTTEKKIKKWISAVAARSEELVQNNRMLLTYYSETIMITLIKNITEEMTKTTDKMKISNHSPAVISNKAMASKRATQVSQEKGKDKWLTKSKIWKLNIWNKCWMRIAAQKIW